MPALSGCSSVWLERLIWVQEAAGSSPVTPINNISYLNEIINESKSKLRFTTLGH